MPPISITHTFDSIEEAQAHLASLGGEAASTAGDAEPAKRPVGRPAGSTKKKTTSKKKAESKKKAASKGGDDEISDEALRLKLNEIVEHESGGGPMAKGFLGKHKKVSDVPQDERQGIVDAVDAKLAELNEGGEEESDDDDFLE